MFKLANKTLSNQHKPFIVAELSGNHQQNYHLAEQMIVQAAGSGADAIKLQTYTADTMTLDSAEKDFIIEDKDSLWKGEKLYDLYARAATPWEWHEKLFTKAKSLGLLAFSSPFDATSVDFLETLNIPCYKIASFENTDLPLIEKVAKTAKPIIMSTGMASIEELSEAITLIETISGNKPLLLKCTSQYPADASDSNLLTISDMQQRFQCPVGLSDHSKGIDVALAATALGAVMIEKHFVLDKKAGGVDADFSIEPHELKQLVISSQRVHCALGDVVYNGTPAEQDSKKYRRSIYVSKDISAGQKITADNIRIIRPGSGLEPKYYSQLLGKTVLQSVNRGTPLSWKMLED